MELTKLEINLTNLQKALDQLKKLSGKENMSDIERDAGVQRFEYVFELSWKTMKTYLGQRGVSTHSPASAIKASFQDELISDFDGWMSVLKSRNLSSHTYSEIVSKKVIDKIPLLVELTQDLIVECGK